MALSQERTFLVGEGDELKTLLRTVLDNPESCVLRPAAKRITDIFDTYLEQSYLVSFSSCVAFVSLSFRALDHNGVGSFCRDCHTCSWTLT
jgi:hypothetical protein